MTIEERAKKEYPAVSPLDYPVTHDYNIAAKNGFIEGANWMLDKVMNLISEVSDKFGRPVDAETFRKALEK